MNPEQKKFKINSQVLPKQTLSQIQKEYCRLIYDDNFCVFSLCEYFYKIGHIVSFVELWKLLLVLDHEGLLVSPHISEWKPAYIPHKIAQLAANHVGYQEKLKASELAILPFFRNLNPHLIDFLSQRTSVHKVESGTQLCKQGHNDRSLYVLLEGQASIYRNDNNSQRMLLTRIEKGAIIGETAFFLGERRTADVIISKPGKIVRVDFDPQLDTIIKTEFAQSLKERLWFLQALVKSPLFMNLPESIFDKLLHSGQSTDLNEGQVLFSEGDDSDCFYIVVQGSILVSQNGRNIGVLTAGDTIGEIAFLQLNSKRTATVSGQTKSILMQIPNNKLMHLIFNSLQLGLLLEKTALERLERDKNRKV